MAYRFTDTDKWNDPWYCELKPLSKLLFNYLCDQCDIAGFLELNVRKMGFDIGADKRAIEGGLKEIEDKIVYSKDARFIYIKNFIRHQKNLPLNTNNNAHKGILKRIAENAELFDKEVFNDLELGASEGLGSPIGKGNGKGSIGDKGVIGEKEDRETTEIEVNGHKALVSAKYDSVMDEMLSDEEAINVLCVNNRSIDSTLLPEDVKEYIKQFFVKKTNENQIGEVVTLKDARQHFANWLRIELNKKQKGGGNGRSKKARQSDEDRADELARSVAQAVANCS